MIPLGKCQCGCGGDTRISTINCKRNGYVKGEPLRYLHWHGSRRTRDSYEIEDRGYSTPCWIKPKRHNRWGYAVLELDGKGIQAHRYFYEKCKGEIPDGLVLDHLCRQPSCVNPDHLEPVTIAENRRRGNGVILSPSSVHEIREMLAAGELQRVIASMYGVTREAISAIKRGINWADCA